MKRLTLHDIVNATGGTLLSGDGNQSISAVCTDTRNLVPDSLFVPIVGETFDGHNFIYKALEATCVASLTAKDGLATDKALIRVPDTRRALGDIAAFYKKQFHIPFVAITGSVGKTTVKELTNAVLSTRFNVLKNEGNFNNDIGLPLTLFRLDDCHEVAITEMGMSDFGEIDYLAGIVKPNIGIVTNIGLSHIEHLGSQENIFQAKAELFSHITADGTVILNGDDAILMMHKNEISQKTVTVGLSSGCDLTATDICPYNDHLTFTVVYGETKVPVSLSFPGEHNVINALLACAAGLALGISLEEAARGLSAYVPKDRRMQLIESDGLTVINDCYNAAPASMEAGLKVLASFSGRKIAVLGDIKELGVFSENAHRFVGAVAALEGIDLLFTFGEHAKWIAESAALNGMSADSVFAFTDMELLLASLKETVKAGDTILVKASRSMRLERVTEFLTSHK